MSTNVVQMWRRRAEQLTRQAWRCDACGVLALVRRRACAACSATSGFTRAPLPRRGTALAFTVAGASVEHLDQVTARKATALLNLGNGSRLACLVTDADAGKVDALRGKPLRLVVRRLPLGHLPTDEPIPYGLKAAADIATRVAVRAPIDKPPEQK